MMGVAVGPSDKTPGDAGQTVNGNYGFSTSDREPLQAGRRRATRAPDHQMPLYAPLPAGPGAGPGARRLHRLRRHPRQPGRRRRMYKATAEEDVNVFDGDSYLRRRTSPPSPRARRTTRRRVTSRRPSSPRSRRRSRPASSPPAPALCTRCKVTNPTFLDGGGSPVRGPGPALVRRQAGHGPRRPDDGARTSTCSPTVPLPTHFWGVTLNDLGLTFDKRSVNYGEAQGLPFVPVGLYDYAGRLVDTVAHRLQRPLRGARAVDGHVQLPGAGRPVPEHVPLRGQRPGPARARSTRTTTRGSAPSPRTSRAGPGLYTVTDEAPTQVASIALAPDGTTANPTQCDLDGVLPAAVLDRPAGGPR